eukprot:318197-Alexandrium_andersonii.AAC.1
MSASLVGSEMCIRDSSGRARARPGVGSCPLLAASRGAWPPRSRSRREPPPPSSAGTPPRSW